MYAFFRTTRFKENSELVALGGCDSGKADARVTACDFNDFSTRLELAFAFGFFNHSEGGAVLHGAGWVEVFELRENVCLGVVIFLEVVEFEERGMTDKFGDRMVNIGHRYLFF